MPLLPNVWAPLLADCLDGAAGCGPPVLAKDLKPESEGLNSPPLLLGGGLSNGGLNPRLPGSGPNTDALVTTPGPAMGAIGGGLIASASGLGGANAGQRMPLVDAALSTSDRVFLCESARFLEFGVSGGEEGALGMDAEEGMVSDWGGCFNEAIEGSDMDWFDGVHPNPFFGGLGFGRRCCGAEGGALALLTGGLSNPKSSHSSTEGGGNGRDPLLGPFALAGGAAKAPKCSGI